MFFGSIPAVITPFRNQKVDYDSLDKIINHLIDKAKKLNIKKLSLETGTGNFFESARKLFYKCGFKPCKPFAHYKKDPDACYMCLLISN